MSPAPPVHSPNFNFMISGLRHYMRRLANKDAFCPSIPRSKLAWCRYVEKGLHYRQQDQEALSAHVCCVEDTQALRDALPRLGLIGFVGNGAILPRCTCMHFQVHDLSPIRPSALFPASAKWTGPMSPDVNPSKRSNILEINHLCCPISMFLCSECGFLVLCQ